MKECDNGLNLLADNYKFENHKVNEFVFFRQFIGSLEKYLRINYYRSL